jgi:FtsH-binding integral membrane protein
VSAVPEMDEHRKRRIRRNVWWLVALALAFYLGFIALSVLNAP